MDTPTTNSTAKRLVAVGRFSTTQDEIVCDPTFQDTFAQGAADATAADEHLEDSLEYESWLDDVAWIRTGC